MTDPRKPEQDDVDDLLLSALYQQGAEEQPPTALDRAIRERAHKLARRRRWFALPKLAVAMTLVLGVVVALRVFDVAPPQESVMDYQAPAKPVAPSAPGAPVQSRAPARISPVGSAAAPEEMVVEEAVEADSSRKASTERDSANAPTSDHAAGQPTRKMVAPPAMQNSGQARRELLMRERAKRNSEQRAGPVCLDDVPPATAGALEWLRRIRELRQVGEQARAACLQELYHQRFSEPDQIQSPSVEE